jgi:hypothetical protein
MPSNDWRDQLPAKVRIQKIIVAALGMGCIAFLAIALVVASQKQPMAQPMLSYIALAFLATGIVPWIIMPGMIVSQGRKKIFQEQIQPYSQIISNNPEEKKEKETQIAISLLGLYQTKKIIACALLEGPAFFLIIAYMLEGSYLALVAAIVLIVMIFLQMPFTGIVNNWIENQLQLTFEERSFS